MNQINRRFIFDQLNLNIAGKIHMKKGKKMYSLKMLQKEILDNRREVQELKRKMDSWIETMEVLSDKRAMKAIAESERDIKAGRVKRWDDVKNTF
ncbi:MAG: hypothetical protein ABIG96_01380 [Candidatus Micrarchaeota archaeon]